MQSIGYFRPNLVKNCFSCCMETWLWCRDATHAEWVKAWNSTLTQLQGYIKKFHTTGVEWNKQVRAYTVLIQC